MSPNLQTSSPPSTSPHKAKLCELVAVLKAELNTTKQRLASANSAFNHCNEERQLLQSQLDYRGEKLEFLHSEVTHLRRSLNTPSTSAAIQCTLAVEEDILPPLPPPPSNEELALWLNLASSSQHQEDEEEPLVYTNLSDLHLTTPRNTNLGARPKTTRSHKASRRVASSRPVPLFSLTPPEPTVAPYGSWFINRVPRVQSSYTPKVSKARPPYLGGSLGMPMVFSWTPAPQWIGSCLEPSQPGPLFLIKPGEL